jgi:hypothetical protein
VLANQLVVLASNAVLLTVQGFLSLVYITSQLTTLTTSLTLNLFRKGLTLLKIMSRCSTPLRSVSTNDNNLVAFFESFRYKVHVACAHYSKLSINECHDKYPIEVRNTVVTIICVITVGPILLLQVFGIVVLSYQTVISCRPAIHYGPSKVIPPHSVYQYAWRKRLYLVHKSVILCRESDRITQALLTRVSTK